MGKNKTPMLRLRTHHAEQLIARYGHPLKDALATHLCATLPAPQQPSARRFSNQTYELLATGVEVRPGPTGCKKLWAQTHSSFRVVLGRDGKWAVYGLPKESLLDPLTDMGES